MITVNKLLPQAQVAFQRFLDTIRRGYERFGFLPIETPVFETVEVLLTKSGGETEKQIYFVQSTGALQQARAPELALRFDLTVPLARYVAEHERDLAFPFRRYQIQRVYRGERAQKGRFREFYQCDIDVIGKDTLPLLVDAEMPAVRARHQFDDNRSLAVTFQTDDDAFVTPFHRRSRQFASRAGTRPSIAAPIRAMAIMASPLITTAGHAPPDQAKPPAQPTTLAPR